MKNLNIYKKLFILLVVIISSVVAGKINFASALTIADKNGNASACPDIYPYNTGSCTAFINSITVNGYTDSDTSSSSRTTPIKGGYIVPNKTVTVSWTKNGATPAAYLVRFGCGDSVDYSNDNNTIGWTTGNSISWSIPSWVANYKYCKVWVYAEEKNGNTSNNPTLGVSNTRAFTIEEEAEPITVACYTTPSRGKVGEEIKIYAEVSGGTAPYDYMWSDDVYGSSKTVYKTFTTSGTKTFKISVTDNKNKSKSATCSIVIDPKDEVPNRYSCNWSTYNCSVSTTGTYSSLNDCNSACKQPSEPTRYSCNWSTYSCSSSTTGAYSSYGECTGECQRPPQQTRYSCNWSTYSCSTSTTGAYSSYGECSSECQQPSQPTRYSCNWSTYSCSTSTTGAYSSYGECSGECQQPPQQTKYSCNRSTYSCNVSSTGAYNSYTACASECQAETPTPRYECNLATYTCNVSTTGQYTSYTECFYGCQKPVNRYACNQTTGQCVLTANGAYTDLATCNNACAIKTVTVDLNANPTIIDRGQTSILSWTSQNATYCVASGGWSGSKSTSGSESVNPYNTTTYSITCYNENNSATDTATVTVRDTNPSVDLSVYPSTIYRGQTAVLSWTSNSVNSCYATNGWSGSKSTYGNETVAPSSTTTYTITCTGVNGSTVSDSVILNVLDQQTDKVLAITKLARNLSAGDQTYAKVIRAKKGDVIEFYLLIFNIHSYTYANNTAVIDRLPAPLSYYINTTKIDNIANVDGIATSGLNLGVLRPGDKKIITFQAIANQDGTYYTITNTAEAEADNVSTVSDSASITYTAVLGASTISTGPMETGILVTGISILITGSTWAYVTKNEKGKKFLKDLEDKQIQKKINSLKN